MACTLQANNSAGTKLRSTAYADQVSGRRVLIMTNLPDTRSELAVSSAEWTEFAVGYKSLNKLYTLLQILHSRRQHQLNTVKLVDFGRTGVEVDSCNIRLRMLTAHFLDNAFADNVIECVFGIPAVLKGELPC